MAEDLKIVLESKLQEAKTAKESLEKQGAFKSDPKKLQELNIAIEKLTSLLKVFDPKSASSLNSVRSSFNKIFDTIIKVGLEAGKASERMKQLYESLKTVTDNLSKKQTARTDAASRLDKKGRISADDAWARQKIIGSGIMYARGQAAKNPETLRANVESAAQNGWQGTFASEKDFNNAQKVVKEIETEERKVQEHIKQLDQEIRELTTALNTVKENIAKEQAKTALPAEVKTASSGQVVVQEAVAQQQKMNQDAAIAENTEKNAAAVSDLNQQLSKQSTTLGKVFKQFSLYAIVLRSAKKALNDAVKTVKDLDKYLTEQAMVTGKTRKETYALLSTYQDMASELGTTTKEIAEVTTQFLRQGKSTTDALTLTRAAVSAAKVAGISGSESVNYLTTALNGFQLAAEDAMKVSDKFAAIAAQSATSYQEIATALSKVASQANIAGMSIDYTTALLAKGIETTREPAESIGTALKTIIARMREITDYGKTLEDGMDINNVETQLAYVGIALRNQNGELRSTEEVLDELGNKWDTLSSNQQAAVAKALAGTRQQSRLIAMMNDYERVTELQQIAQRSAGATAAQAAVYMEGMEAALNKINVAWEKIVSSITDSNVIINILNVISSLLDRIGEFLSTDFGMIATLTVALTIGASILGQKMMEYQIAQEQKQLDLERQQLLIQEQLQKNKNAQIEQKSKIAQKETNVESLKAVQLEKKKAIEKIKARKADYAAKEAEARALGDAKKAQGYKLLQAKAAKELSAAEADLTKFEKEQLNPAQEQLKAEQDKLSTLEKEEVVYKQQQTLLSSQQSMLSKLSFGLTSIVSIISMGVMAYKAMAAGIGMVIKLTQKEERAKLKAAIADKIKAAWGMAGSASAIPVAGWVIAAGILLTILGITIGTAIAKNVAYGKSADKAADDVNKLSNEIYKLTEKANAIKSIERQYDALDNKIVKTTEDQKKMNELLDSAGDKLSSENQKDKYKKDIEGTSEQDIYKSLQSEKARREYLAQIEDDATRKANQKRREQILILQKLSEAERKRILTSKENADFLKTQDSIYATNNNTLYEYLDTLGNVGEGVEQLTQNILEQMDAEEAYKYATDDSGAAIKRLANTINNASTVIEGSQVSLAEVLDSTKYSFEDKIKAYNDLYASIAALGDPVLLDSFESAYGQWDQLQKNMSAGAISFMDRIGVSIDKLNDFGKALNKLGIETEDAMQRISDFFDMVNSGADVSSTITRLFADVLAPYKPGSKEYKAVYNSILNAYQDAAGTGLLNMGQNLKSLQSQINSLYETASKWSSMSKDEQTSFIQDNYELFQGANGAELFRAFQTGDYKQIQSALATNKVLKEQIGLRLEQLKIDLQIAEAASDRNEAEIAWLKEQIAALEDYENVASSVYQAELSLRLEQENKQLEIYKSYLEKQKDALNESLDQRREAYQKYFDTINQEKEDEDYELQAATLTANLSKLTSSTDAGSRQQAKELEQQLQELEKERLETLRERAQEAVLNNLDIEVSQINEKFDKLLENQAALLDAMNQDISADPNSFVSRLASSGIENMTATQAEDYIKNTLIPAFDSSISGDVLDGIKVHQEGSSLFLTLNNQEIEISNSNQQELSAIILAALRGMGISI